MKIMDKIRWQRNRMIGPGGQALARDFQEQSTKAVLGGSGSDAWRTYMSNFHSNPEQLQRLMGEDNEFMSDPDGWGPTILAYIAGGGTCGGGTNFAQVVEMSTPMKNYLDQGVSVDTSASETFEEDAGIVRISDDLKKFLEDEPL